jgi:hypothetical protein
MIILILVIFLIVIPLMLLFYPRYKNYFGNTSTVFKSPPSFTKLSVPLSQTKLSALTVVRDKKKGSLLDRYTEKLNQVITDNTKTINKVNIIQIPTFFNCGEKWPGCLPRPLYQGSCGSCWGFASVTCLSSRFYIETCGNSSCGTYPQINSGSIDDVYINLNEVYNFNKIYLKNITEYVDINKDGIITKSEWVKCVQTLQKKLWSLPKHNQDRYFILQLLVHILDFQSLGSMSLKDIPSVKKRAELTFDVWLNALNDKNAKNAKKINTNELLSYWRQQPLNLSAEKLITCCVNCYKLEFNASQSQIKNNPACMGGSLQDAWTLLRDIGTAETLCIGYNLDNYREGDELPSCRELQGPFYSFCTGYKFKDDPLSNKDINEELNRIENSGAYPSAVSYESKYPWIDPQLMRFKAKNAYTVSNNVFEIQREIMQRGPVNSGFYTYNDFQTNFGGTGLGGQLYNGENPLGSDSTCLIYMRDPELTDNPTGGHAITIVGWGTFIYKNNGKEYNIPYWTCLNSWGVEWGHSGFSEYPNRNNVPKNLKGGGYFWIVRGLNNCGIEENVTCGQPNIENLSYPGIVNKYGWGEDPPSIDNKNINFLPPLDTSSLINANNKKLDISPTIIGGGGFVDFVPPSTYDIKSMTAPSPFIMFWQTARPTFCIGLTQNYLSTIDDVIKITQTTANFFAAIRSNVYKNPLLLIGDGDNQEQVQLLKLDKLQITVGRGVNFNKPKQHKKNSNIKVFPYQDLSIDFLKNNGFIQCSLLI